MKTARATPFSWRAFEDAQARKRAANAQLERRAAAHYRQLIDSAELQYVIADRLARVGAASGARPATVAGLRRTAGRHARDVLRLEQSARELGLSL